MWALVKIRNYINNKRVLNEPKKRSLVAELKEVLRSFSVKEFSSLMGEKND